MDALEESLNWTRSYLEWMDGVADFAAGRELRRHDVFRETMRLMAARAESDCAQAAHALGRVEHLLEQERAAWHAFGALRGFDRRHNGAPATSSQEWEDALEAVVAEVHALESKVLALRSGALAL